MKVAVTGGSGFVGRRLVSDLTAAGHDTVSVSRGIQAQPNGFPGKTVHADVGELSELRNAFEGCEVVVHLAGINRSKGKQTFQRVHVEGTRNAVNAAKAVGARKIVLLSFLKARPGTSSEYHETKYESEQVVAQSGLDYTVLKAGVIYGPGDGMLTNIWRGIKMAPVFATVSMKGTTLRPVWVGDVSSIIVVAATQSALSRKTVAVLGPEEMKLGEAVRRVARAKNRTVLITPLPVAAHYVIGFLSENLMPNPLVSVAQVKMLAEGVSDPLAGMDQLPSDLAPKTQFDSKTILESI